MNQLVSIRTNVFYLKEPNTEKEFTRLQEIILLVDKPKYTYSNEGEVLRERAVEELRFSVGEEALEQLISQFEKLKNVDPNDLA
jgi:hypothetical protein